MKKAFSFILILLLSPILAGLYGILHDQLTFTISPEYYFKFKFEQFGVDTSVLLTPRQGVTVVGFLATWWTGILVGLGHGLTGLIHKDSKIMLKVVSKATLLTLVIAFLVGLIGLAYGKFFLAPSGVNWWLPDDLVDKENFIAVGSMHNFSYFGGLIGLAAGITYQVRQRKINGKILVTRG